MAYSWQLPDWPRFTYSTANYAATIQQYVERVNFLAGAVHGLAEEPKLELTAYQMAIEGSYSSRIEGLDVKVSDIKKSIYNNLRPDLGHRNVHDQRAGNLADIVTNNYRTYTAPLTEAQLFSWHRQLVAHRSDMKQVGSYRTGGDKMQIVSGPFGRETIYYEAPPSGNVVSEMKRYLDWFNGSQTEYSSTASSVIRSGIAHLYFEMIHPFEDGNGRIGRVIAEKALGQGLGYPLPFSISYIIGTDTAAYYTALQRVNSKLDITDWLDYYAGTCLRAVERGYEVYKFTLSKVSYFQRFDARLIESERKVILRMWAAGPEGFQGGMTPKKYVRLTRVSPATATRSLAKLTRLGALTRHGGGRSTHYRLPVSPPTTP